MSARKSFAMSAGRTAARWGITSLRCRQPLRLVIPLLQTIQHRRMVGPVPDMPLPHEVPRLSIILAVRDDEATVAATIAALLEQDYPNLELVLVSDRSADGTGAILDNAARTHPGRVQVVTIEELPAGWTGKQYAIRQGERAAGGEWLLLTDGDALLDPTCCSRVMAFALAAGCDHITMLPRLISSSYWALAFYLCNHATATAWSPFYKVNDPTRSIGAGFNYFNLICRTVYHAIGTHAEFGYTSIEDTRLGQRVKRLGFRQHVFGESNLLALQYYPSLRATITAYDKLLFPWNQFSRRSTLRTVGWLYLYMTDPWVSVWHSRRLNRWLLLGALLTQITGFLSAHRRVLPQALCALPSFPAAVILVAYAHLHSMQTMLARGGMAWRDTFYPLDELSARDIESERRLRSRREEWQRAGHAVPLADEWVVDESAPTR